MNKTMKNLLSRVQQGIPISSRPYRGLGQEIGLSENEVISYLPKMRKSGLLKRVDFCIDTRKLGLVSTLVGCKISKNNIPRARKVLDAYGNVSHNYLRKHRLNMWFTLSAATDKKLNGVLAKIKKELAAQELASLPTQKVYKLKFQLNVA
ncbi:MAG: Lrp/AsnC family transcriptional regulator [Candidatus Omnitrophica bacterium]|nr:Lrp/AsnC family transcriptional regulator [Candidatus Omnitrophota bacterium]MBU4468213.1 Lrp/AsnC family transcriptional regulator [Candidatus Omnitrophota bacterium]MCG2708288.1 Lrp/AsnC family transcriptional regulator [Candidatus Omnitrophota bacterium]